MVALSEYYYYIFLNFLLPLISVCLFTQKYTVLDNCKPGHPCLCLYALWLLSASFAKSPAIIGAIITATMAATMIGNRQKLIIRYFLVYLSQFRNRLSL